jgi:phage-related protein
VGYESLKNLFECKLCDTVDVVFPEYNTSGQFKIVKTVWDVLRDKYESMELGDLSVTLAEALGIRKGK